MGENDRTVRGADSVYGLPGAKPALFYHQLCGQRLHHESGQSVF